MGSYSYWQKDLGNISKGNYIEVILDVSANVRIMTKENYDKYMQKLPHGYIGGYVRFTPYTAVIPEDGHWFIVVDLGGQPGKVNSSVSIFRKVKKDKPQVTKLS